jgi:hypothetical protein
MEVLTKVCNAVRKRKKKLDLESSFFFSLSDTRFPLKLLCLMRARGIKDRDRHTKKRWENPAEDMSQEARKRGRKKSIQRLICST